MVAKKLNIVKPTAGADRCSQAVDFAEQTKGNLERFETAKGVISNTDTYREVFDAPLELRQNLKLFLATTDKFKNKREFMIQCMRDGLEKYK